jgi:hypothetical protein
MGGTLHPCPKPTEDTCPGMSAVTHVAFGGQFMEVRRFDTLARQVGAAETRRGLLGLLFGSALGGLLVTRLADHAEAKKRKKKKKCKGCTECQSCKKGKCKPKPDGPACGSGGQTCQAGACACPAGQEDSGGVYGTRPACPGNGSCDAASDCCSDACFTQTGSCLLSNAGDRCLIDSDCYPPAPYCRGFVCRAT